MQDRTIERCCRCSCRCRNSRKENIKAVKARRVCTCAFCLSTVHVTSGRGLDQRFQVKSVKQVSSLMNIHMQSEPALRPSKNRAFESTPNISERQRWSRKRRYSCREILSSADIGCFDALEKISLQWDGLGVKRSGTRTISLAACEGVASFLVSCGRQSLCVCS